MKIACRTGCETFVWILPPKIIFAEFFSPSAHEIGEHIKGSSLMLKFRFI